MIANLSCVSLCRSSNRCRALKSITGIRASGPEAAGDQPDDSTEVRYAVSGATERRTARRQSGLKESANNGE